MPLSEQDRKICETIVEAFMEKCDMVNPDGSTHEDYERDLIEPFATALRLAREEERERCAREIESRPFTYLFAHQCVAGIRSLSSSPAAEEYDPPELESWAVKEGK